MIKILFQDKKNRNLLIWMMIAMMIIHLPLFTKNILTADVLLNNFYYHGYSWELSLGRFGLLFIGILKSYLVIPHIEMIISMFLLAITSLMIIHLFKIENTLSKYMICLLVTTSPSVSSTLLFHYCSIGYCLAFFFSVFSLYSFIYIKNKYLKYVLPILCIILSLSFYQAYIQTTLVLFTIYIIHLILNRKFTYPFLLKSIIILATSLIGYFILMKLSLAILGISLSSYSGANSFGLNNLLHIPNRILDTYQVFFSFLFKDELVLNHNVGIHIINAILLITGFVFLTIHIVKRKISLRYSVLSYLLIFLLPLFSNFILLIIPDTKIQLLMAQSYLLIYISLFSIPLKNKSRYLLLLLCALLCRSYLIQDSATYMSLEITFNKTYKIANSLVDRIHELGDNKKVMITGNLDKNSYYHHKTNHELNHIYNLNYGFVANDSLFWDEYTNIKNGWTRYLYEYLGVNIDFVDVDTYNHIMTSNEYKKMKPYPNQNSIQLIDDTIVIKF